MTWQSLSRLTHSPRASLTAFCSLAALSPSPGRPDRPTATAFHPVDAAANLRATSSLESVAIEEFLSGRKKPVTFNVVGTGTTKTSSRATIRQGTPATAPQDSRFRRAASSTVSTPELKKYSPPGPSAIVLVFRAGT